MQSKASIKVAEELGSEASIGIEKAKEVKVDEPQAEEQPQELQAQEEPQQPQAQEEPQQPQAQEEPQQPQAQEEPQAHEEPNPWYSPALNWLRSRAADFRRNSKLVAFVMVGSSLLTGWMLAGPL
jgi:hypothetical protein